MAHSGWSRLIRTALAVLGCIGWAGSVMAQGVTTGSMIGVATDSQGGVLPGANVSAVHVPSGTQYETVTQDDGRFIIPAMRVGGPYTVVVELAGLGTETKNDVNVSLGTSADLQFVLNVAGVSEQVQVVANAIDPTFGSQRTGAATSVTRADIARLPTISGRINDITRLTPQAGGGGSFGGVDNRLNNISVDGSYFNNSFGLGGQPGDRTGVAPISLESIEEVQVSLAPYDVRQGAFVGANVNTVTRSGTNRLTGSFYYRMRDESFVGKEAKGLPFNPGTFKTNTTGGWLGGPIIRNRLFAFGSYENQKDERPLTTFLANPGGAPATGNTTRVLASDLNRLSSYLSQNFNYETGPYENITDETPGKPFLIKGDYNVNGTNKVTFRYNQLSSDTDVNLSSSSSLGNGRQTFSNNFLNYQGSNYTIIENIKSGIGEWNSVIGTSMSNNLIVGYSKQDESRGQIDTLFPFVDILDGSNVGYTAFGSEPFTPNNELRYDTFQLQDSFSKFFGKHSLVFGVSVEKYHSENVFFPGKQSAYVYNTIDDFFADAAGYLANPNRTTSPINLRRFQVRYMNLPDLDTPVQPLDVWYTGAYVQDNWRPRSNLTINAGVRVDISSFGDTAYANPAVDALTFRDQTGSGIQYSTGALPDATPLWSPRVGFNWDLFSNQTTQLRGGTGVFTGKPAYVWISNQIGNTGVLTGFTQADNTTAFPFNPNPDAYKPANVTGAPAASVDLAVTADDFKFPQIWRTNVGVDHRLPWGVIATGDVIYNRDVNGMAYINANLPAPQSAFGGVDARPRWVGPACGSGTVGPCQNRINNVAGNQITQAIVLQNQDVGRNWNYALGLSKSMRGGFSVKGAYSYGEAKNLIDPGSIAAGSWTGNAIVNDPNNPALAFSSSTPGHRYYVTASYSREYFKFGATTVSAFWESRTSGNTSFVFSGDMNGDSASGNDLIYIPRNASEMNFQTFTESGRTFTADEQAAAFENFIQQDPYLREHRGEYAQRNAAFLKMVGRMDLSIMQDVFRTIGGQRHTGQIRLDITNFGNLLNSDWGVGERIVQNQILTNATTDAQGRLTYRMARVGGQLPASPRLSTAGISDVYVMMLSFRYGFNF
jgi:outer membrane receptor protein involved in Fe transport